MYFNKTIITHSPQQEFSIIETILTIINISLLISVLSYFFLFLNRLFENSNKNMLPSIKRRRRYKPLSLPKNFNVTKSNIMECKVNNTVINKLYYFSILIEVYKKLLQKMNIDNLVKLSNFNIKTYKTESKGFRWIKELGLSIQRQDSNKTLNEILSIVKFNKLCLNVKIKLSDNSIVNIWGKYGKLYLLHSH